MNRINIPRDNRVVGCYCTSKLFQDDVSWQKNKSFQKKPSFVWISKKPNWVPAEWCWRLRFENTMRHFVIISYYFLMFWQNISLCPQISAVSTIQQDSIWLLWNTKQRGHFLKIFVFLPEKHSLKLYGITQNMKSPK